MPPFRSRPEFFLDRSLGGRDVADAFRSAGWIIRTCVEVYADRDQEVEDVEWLSLCGREADRRSRWTDGSATTQPRSRRCGATT